MNKKIFIQTLRKEIDTISNEISDLLHKDDVFRNRTKTLLEESSIDIHVRNEIVRNHYSTVLVAIRRQLGTDDSEISLLKLLEKLKTHSRVITKEWYAEEWLKDSSMMQQDNSPELKEVIENIPISEFEKNFGENHLDHSNIMNDIKVLKSATDTVKTFVDKRLAHTDKKSVKSVSEKEYLEALELLENLTTKYVLLLKQVGISLKPVIQD